MICNFSPLVENALIKNQCSPSENAPSKSANTQISPLPKCIWVKMQVRSFRSILKRVQRCSTEFWSNDSEKCTECLQRLKLITKSEMRAKRAVCSQKGIHHQNSTDMYRQEVKQVLNMYTRWTTSSTVQSSCNRVKHSLVYPNFIGVAAVKITQVKICLTFQLCEAYAEAIRSLKQQFRSYTT